MKRVFLLMTTILLLMMPLGCTQTPQEEAPPEQEPEQTQPLHLTSLSIELQRDGQDAQQLLEAIKVLPEQLQTALASYDVTVDEISMTVGSSHTATIQALESGSIDLAFLSAETLAEQSTTVDPIALSGPLFWDQGEDLAAWNHAPEEAPLIPGYRALICAAPTEYGKNLASRESLTWEELDRARWGVLAEDSILGYRGLNLWLADHYEGNTISDLSQVKVYDSFAALLRAAADGTADLFPMDESQREDWAEAWSLPQDETDSRGNAGFGRPGSIWEEVPVLGLTDWFYDMAIAASPTRSDLFDSHFAEALSQAVRDLATLTDFDRETRLLALAAFGDFSYAPASDGALDATRRLLTIE